MSNQEPIYLLPQYIENCFDSITGNLKVNSSIDYNLQSRKDHWFKNRGDGESNKGK